MYLYRNPHFTRCKLHLNLKMRLLRELMISRPILYKKKENSDNYDRCPKCREKFVKDNNLTVNLILKLFNISLWEQKGSPSKVNA